MTGERIEIALCIDAGMVVPATVALSSIAQHVVASRSVRVHVVTTAPADAMAAIRAVERPGFDVIIQTVENPYALFPENSYITPATYLRFLLPQILDVDKVLYLDADVVVSRDIGELFDIELEDCAVAAVPDAAMSIGSRYQPGFSLYYDGRTHTFASYQRQVLGLSDIGDDSYFNAGVMLVDLAAWRRSDFVTRVIDFLTSHPESSFMDQDGLNVVCAGRYIRLDPRWNSVVGATAHRAGRLRRHFDLRAQRWDEICTAWLGDAWITHYAGPRKPWNRSDVAGVPLAARWWCYARRSPAASALPGDILPDAGRA